jgi:Protein of function (DUF2518)
MLESLDFRQLALYGAWASLGSLGLTILAFLFKWGFRFRLVGVTSFLIVLATGTFALSFSLREQIAIEGAVPYTVVYDAGGSLTVASVAPTIPPEAIEPTLRQATLSLASTGRFSAAGETDLTVRLRTLLHPQEGLTQPLLLGEARRPLGLRGGDEMDLRLHRAAVQELERYQRSLAS